MSYIDKQEYEERHGDHVGYCRVHHITVLDSCPYCDDDRLQECAQCHYSIYDAPDDFSWAEIDGEMQLLCWGCTDKLHKGSMVIDSPSDIPAHNIDYRIYFATPPPHVLLPYPKHLLPQSYGN